MLRPRRARRYIALHAWRRLEHEQPAASPRRGFFTAGVRWPDKRSGDNLILFQPAVLANFKRENANENNRSCCARRFHTRTGVWARICRSL